MSYNNKSICAFLFAIITVNAFGQSKIRENIVELKMDTILNTNIQLKVGYENKNFVHNVFYIPGELENKTWRFYLPDSIQSINYLSLSSPMDNDSVENSISLSYVSVKDTLSCGNFKFKNGHSISILKYVKSIISPNIFYTDKKTGEGKFKKIHLDQYMIEETNDMELLSSIENLIYTSKFYNNKIPYEDKIQKYISLAKEYPNSNSLIIGLASYMTNYNSKEDVAKIYNCFSDEAKNTYYGKKIKHYLTQTFFDNNMLPSWDTEIPELIIKDETKYTLVVFSASWCGPCHKMIPTLKQIYNDLKDEINIVYISIDEDRSVKLWKELMIKEEIPWRSVLAKDQIMLIKNKYAVQGIPCTFLVNPNKEITRIELWNNEERIELYRLFNKQP